MNQANPADHGRASRRRSLFDPVGRIVDSVVPTVADAVDIDELVGRVDVDGLIGRIDLDALIGRIDLDALIGRIDLDALIDRIDLDALIGRIDLDGLIDRIDVDRLVGRIDLDTVIGKVDMNGVMERVDLDAVVGRVDVDSVIQKVDVNGVMGRVDLDHLLASVDLDAVVDQIDVDRIMQRADIAGVVAKSTRGITANTVDLVRRQIVGIDEIVTRIAARVARRDPDAGPDAPSALRVPAESGAPTTDRSSISGHYAGPVARVAAFAADWSSMVFLFGIATAVVSWTLDLLFGEDRANRLPDTFWSSVLLIGWALLYFTVPLSLTGRTLGKAIVGLKVVGRDGRPLRPAQALVRVLFLPLSFALLGLGLVGALFGRERRTLHDVIARSTEVIDWGDRPAALPRPLDNWLARRQQVV